MYRRKRRACGTCKPGKRGVVKRWSGPEEFLIRDFDRERRRWLGRSI
jgi:hypothetical protein